MQELTESWCFISRTLRTNALVDHGDFPLRAAVNWPQSSLHTPAVHYIISRRPSTSAQINVYLITCCFIFLLLTVYRTTFKCASRSYLQWLHLPRCGGPTGVCVAPMAQWVVQWMTCLSFGSICILSHLAEIFVEPWLTGMQKGKKMITERSGKSWGIYS